MKLIRLSAILCTALCFHSGERASFASGAFPTAVPDGAAHRMPAVNVYASAGPPRYAIHAYQDYCEGGGTYCVTGGTNGYPAAYLAGYSFSELNVYGLPGELSGTPSYFYAECDSEYWRDGLLTYDWTYIFTYPIRTGPGMSTRALSQVGSAAALGDATESGAATLAPVNVSASEQYQLKWYSGAGPMASFQWVPWHVDVSVTGTNVDNNTIDKTVGGAGYAIDFRGSLYRSTFDPRTGRWTRTLASGSIGCTAGGPQANDLVNAGLEPSSWAYAEAENEPNFGG